LREGARRGALLRFKIRHHRGGLATVSLLTAGLLLVSCETAATIPQGKLSQLVLTQEDMQGFTAFYRGTQVRLDNDGTNRSDGTRFSREGGWIVRYRPSQSTTTTGPLVVESRLDLFKSSDGAKSDFVLYRALLTRTAGGNQKEIVVAGLPQDSVGVTFTQAGGRTLRFYRIAWRDRNATASVTVEGFDGEITQEQAIALAKKQESHIKGA
jgi:hypothetical protein